MSLWPKKEIRPLTFPDTILHHDRCYLRPIQISDYPQWQTVRARNEARLRPLEPKWAQDCLSRGFFERRIKRQIRDWHSDRAYCFVLFRNDRDTLIGGMNINHVQRGAAHFASLGYWIDEQQQGQGYMQEAGEMITEYAFAVLKLNRLNAACLPENDRSKNLLLRLGFAEEGFAKNYLEINGQFQDHILFGLVNPVRSQEP